MTLHDVALDDKFDLGKQRIFLSGSQAVVRMLLMQRERDRLAGLDTAGFVSGYRGSPLGGLDQQLWRPRSISRIPASSSSRASTRNSRPPPAGGRSRPDCSAKASMTACFRVWYGKGPGVDRSGDVFRHANLAGSSKHGGVLALMGDDHTAESSTNAHATEFLFVDTMIPILNPARRAGTDRLRPLRLCPVALRRHLGGDQMRQGQHRIDGVGRRLARTAEHRHPRVRHAARRPQHPPRDRLARPGGAAARIQARRRRRLHPRQRAEPHRLFRAAPTRRSASSRSARAISTCARRSRTSASTRRAPTSIGVRLFKVGCPWPLDIEHLKDFARGLEMIIVVEEKRSLIEVQVREDLYGTAMQPTVDRQEGRTRRLAVPGQGRARSERHRHRARRAGAQGDRSVRGHRRPRQPAEAVPGDARRHRRHRLAHALLLLGLPAQFIDQGARGLDRRRRHRLPFHGAVDGPLDHRLHRRWAARARSGSARRRSPSATTSSRISATAPTTIPACWRCASRSPPTPTSPTRSSTTMPSP